MIRAPTDAGGDADHERLGEELCEDGAVRAADRLAEADLLGALGDDDQHDVHDADGADAEGDQARGREEEAHREVQRRDDADAPPRG